MLYAMSESRKAKLYFYSFIYKSYPILRNWANPWYIIRQVLQEDFVHLLNSFRFYEELASPFCAQLGIRFFASFPIGIICAQVKVIPRPNFRAECVIISLKSLKYQQFIFFLCFSARYFQQDR